MDLFKQAHPCWMKLAVSADSGEAHRFKCSEVLRRLFLITGSLSIAPVPLKFLWNSIKWMSLQGAQPWFAVSQSPHPSEEWTSVKIYNSSFKLHLNTCPTFYNHPDKQLLSSRRYIRCAHILLGMGLSFILLKRTIWLYTAMWKQIVHLFRTSKMYVLFSSDHVNWKC